MAMTGSADWDDSTLVGSDPVYLTPREILYLKQAINLRLSKEHEAFDEASVGGEHLEGSARIYLPADATALAALTKPDGTTALDTDDAGRIAYNVEDGELSYHDGSAWQNVTIGFGAWSAVDSDDGTLAADEVYQVMSDGFLKLVCTVSTSQTCELLIGSTSSPTVEIAHVKGYGPVWHTICVPITKNTFWKATESAAGCITDISWMPIGIGECEKQA